MRYVVYKDILYCVQYSSYSSVSNVQMLDVPVLWL